MSEFVTTDVGPWFPVPLWLCEKVGGGAVKTYAILGAKWAHREDKACYPSHKTLADEIGCAVSTVRLYLNELEKAGALKREQRHRADGSMTSCHYSLISADPRRESDIPPPTDRRPPADESATKEPESINQNQLTRDINLISSSTTEYELQELTHAFADFWIAYPHKVGKQAALRQFKKVWPQTTLEDLIAGVERYKKHVESERENGFEELKWQAAAPWLNAGRWEDEYETESDLFTEEEREAVLADARALDPEEIQRRQEAQEYPYDAETRRRLGKVR